MRYEVYIDVLFLENLCMDLGLLAVTGKLLKAESSAGRMILAGLAGAVLACAAALLPFAEAELPAFLGWVPAALTVLVLLFLPALMVWIAFRPSGLQAMARDTLVLWAAAAALGGLMEALYRYAAWLFAAGGAFFLFRYIRLTLADVRREKSCLRKVVLQSGDIRVQAFGFVDTGNRLCEPEKGGPVHIVSEKLWKKLLRPDSRIRRIPYRTIGNPWGLMEIMEIQSLTAAEDAKIRWVPAWIGRAPFPLSKDGSYEILLHEES